MIYLKEKLRIIFNKLSTMLVVFKRMCAIKLDDIPIKINEVVVGIDKLRAYLSNFIEYEINESDINYLTELRSSMFYGCTNLVDITIPDSITSIGYNTFGGCISLTNITIPDSVTSIGSSAFFTCTNLTDIYLKPTTPPTLGSADAIPSATTIHVPIGSGDAYNAATNWSSFASNIIEDIEI